MNYTWQFTILYVISCLWYCFSTVFVCLRSVSVNSWLLPILSFIRVFSQLSAASCINIPYFLITSIVVDIFVLIFMYINEIDIILSSSTILKVADNINNKLSYKSVKCCPMLENVEWCILVVTSQSTTFRISKSKRKLTHKLSFKIV